MYKGKRPSTAHYATYGRNTTQFGQPPEAGTVTHFRRPLPSPRTFPRGGNATSHRGRRDHHPSSRLYSTAPQPKQALDPDTRAAAKKIFKLIQAIHHREIIDHAISTNTPPVGMNRQVNRLTAFIKPASPTEEFRQQVAANTQTWMQNNFTLLRNHYTEIIVFHTDICSTQTTLTVAKGWAEKRYGHQLHPDTFTILSSITFDTAAATGTHVSEPDRDAAAADTVTQPSTEGQFDVMDKRQFPKLS